MEALTPPPGLERAVLALIPPCAREAVAGDLCETYQTPRQYLREALRTLPFVIASQARRNLNMPLLLLQTALVGWLLGGLAAALAVPLLLLREAWRPHARPGAVHAIRETMAIALLAMVIVQAIALHAGTMRQWNLNYANLISLYFFGFLVAPVLCLLRTGVIVTSDRAPAPGALTREALLRDYRTFLRCSRRRNLLEGVALAAMALLLYRMAVPALLVSVFALVGAWLLAQAMLADAPAADDFAALRARYKQALNDRQQLRRFLWCLWLVPLLLLLHDRFQHGLAARHPIQAIMAAAAMLLLCFLLSALNREQGGRAQEDIVALDRLREAAG